MTQSLSAKNITVGYGEKIIINDLSVDIPAGEFTAIIGPNACGKSTLLKTLSRMLEPKKGVVELNGKNIKEYSTKEVARQLGLLPQSPISPEGIRVEDLVGRGRYPHQGLFNQWSSKDTEAVERAMARAKVSDLKDRYVSSLSGGQRQRVWIALVLAQETPIVLLDEPTTYLDITHQVEVLSLARSLKEEGFTVVAVLHELSLAFRYASNLIMMKNGSIVAQGDVKETVTPELIEQVYELPCDILTDPRSGSPIVVPR
ncbi:MAG: ABC transporter ATP-binding protein [Corynebacterium sp.]|nr:ABC transporter ATP-binding protein [Corynebacterium sp.]